MDDQEWHNIAKIFSRPFRAWGYFGYSKQAKSLHSVTRAENPNQLHNARINKESDWHTFEDIYRFKNKASDLGLIGPSFRLIKDYGLVIIDIDKYKGDPNDRAAIAAHIGRQEEIVSMAISMGHVVLLSASGLGAHIIVGGTWPNSRNNLPYGLGEIYHDQQYVNITGKVLPPGNDVPRIRMGDDLLQWIRNKYFPTGVVIKADVEVALEDTQKNGRRLDLTDEQLVTALMSSGDIQMALWHGLGYDASSENLSALLSALDKLSGSPQQIHDVIKTAPIYLREPFDKKGEDRHHKLWRTRESHMQTIRTANDKYFENSGNRATWRIFQELHLMTDDVRAGILRGINGPGSIVYENQVREDNVTKVVENLAPPEDKQREYTDSAIGVMDYLRGDLPGHYMKLSYPSGNAGDFAQYCYQAMYEPVQELAIVSALTSIAGIVARKFKLIDGQGPILQVLLAARTGLGKNQTAGAGRLLIERIINGDRHGNPALVGVRGRHGKLSPSSKAGLSGELSKLACFCNTIEECEPLLKSMASEKATPQDVIIRNFLLETYDLPYAETVFKHDVSIMAKNRADNDVYNVCLSLLMATTTENANKYIDTSFLKAGFGSRVIFMLYKGMSGINQPRGTALTHIPNGPVRNTLATLLGMAEDIDKVYEQAQIGGAMEAEMGKNSRPPANIWNHITTIQETREAADFLQGLENRINTFKRDDQANPEKYQEHYTMFLRIGMQISRIAGLLAVMESPTNPVINLQQVHWATGYMLQRIGAVVSAFDRKELGARLEHSNQLVIETLKQMLTEREFKVKGYVELYKFNERLRNKAVFKNENIGAVRIALDECEKMGLIERILLTQNNKSNKKGYGVYPTNHEIWSE